jgi:hypothetical protein
LLASKKRVAVGANIDMDAARRGARFDHLAARANNLANLIFRVYARFHRFLSNESFITQPTGRFNPPVFSEYQIALISTHDLLVYIAKGCISP